MKKTLYLLVFGCVLLTSCDNFLSRTPVASIGSDNFFTDESSLKTYTNGFLVNYTPGSADIGYGDGNCDIILTTSSSSYLNTPVWTSDLQGSWTASSWKPMYNINYFLKHFREVPDLSEETYNHYEGTARFWRAWQYFEKVKLFGAVPWYDEPIDSDDEEALYKGRDSREFVMDKVLEDLNFACENILATSEWVNNAQISKYVALAYKSRVCLFEGTYRKYHTVDPSTGQAWEDKGASERFLRECANACEELMDYGVYSLVNNPANVKTQYRKLFTSEEVDYTEVIWALEMSTSMTTYNELTWRYTSGSYGSRWSLDQDFVQTYLNLDGSRHTETGEEFTDEIQNRDYRLQQTIITPGYTKLIGGVETLFAQDFAVTLNGYQIIKWNIDDKSYESSKICTNSCPIIRYAEVLLNYAEAKAELGEFDDDIWNKTIYQLRERSGVKGTRPTTPDPYLQEYYGISDTDILEIRRERAIELVMENSFRTDDLYRWHLGEKFNKQWYGIYIPEMNVSYDLNGDGEKDVCVVQSTAGSESGVDYIILDGSYYSLEYGDHGRLMWNIERYFEEPLRYLRPIPKTATNINPNLGQNYYWELEGQ